MSLKIIAGAATALILVTTVQAQAQTRRSASSAAAATPASAPAATLVHGPPLPGVCVFSGETAVATSAVGQVFQTRLLQLRSQASAEISGDESALRTDVQAFEAKRNSLTQEQQQQQAAPLQQREQALNQKASQLQAALEYTYRHQLTRIDEVMEPIERNVYQDRHCSLLLNGAAVQASNPAMDITPAVVTQLNARMSTISFDRETPPAGAR